jgi:hypothetical protein
MLRRLNESVDTMHLFLKIQPNEEVVLHNLKSVGEIFGEKQMAKRIQE